MDTVQNQRPTGTRLISQTYRDAMNNEVVSTSSDDSPTHTHTAGVIKKYNKLYTSKYPGSTLSDNEALDDTRRKTQMISRSHYKSMGNINDAYANEDRNLNSVQSSLSHLDLSTREVKKYETFQIPIVGYEVMEERARFTIYKLKVEDNKRDQSWLVFRRYTDFVRLYSRIKAEQLNISLPLPGKRWFRDNFDHQFLEERVRGLQVFVNAVMKKLPNHPVVREFFCLDEPPQVFSYQPEVQAVYGALEESITSLKVQLQNKDMTIAQLQQRLSRLEAEVLGCPSCSEKFGVTT